MAIILLVEDDPFQAAALNLALTRWGHTVLPAHTRKCARSRIRSRTDISLIILDRRLPDGDGLSLCRHLKKAPTTRHIPVVVLTGMTGFKEEIRTLAHGADLYLPKPAPLQKLRQYIAVLAARAGPPVKRGETTFGTFRFDAARRTVLWDGLPLPALTRTQFAVLHFLASKEGRFVSRRALVWVVWKNRVRDKEVDVVVSRLRHALGEEAAALIHAQAAAGYALQVGRRRNPTQPVAHRLQTAQNPL